MLRKGKKIREIVMLSREQEAQECDATKMIREQKLGQKTNTKYNIAMGQKIIELDIEVEDVSEFNDEASEILESFCLEQEAKGLTRLPADEDEESLAEEYNFKYFWTDEGRNLIEKKIDELYAIGVKYFGQTIDLDISTHMFREP